MFSLYPKAGERKKTAAAVGDVEPDAAWWKCDEESGETLADSANSNDATLNDVTWESTSRGTKPLFNALTSYGTVTAHSSISIYTNQAITIAGWVYPKSSGEGGSGMIVDKYSLSGETTGSGYHFYVDNSNGTVMYDDVFVGMTETDAWKAGKRLIPEDAWTHLATTFNLEGDNKPLNYMNGEAHDILSDDAGVGTIKDDSTVSLSIGALQEPGSLTFDGYLDDIRIYTYALTAEQILRVYNATE